MGYVLKIPFIGQSYENRSVPVSNQQSINWYPETEIADSRNVITLQSVSGIKSFATLLAGRNNIRGMHFSEGQRKLFVVAGPSLFIVSMDGTFTNLGDIDGEGLVSMADRGAPTDANGNQIVIATGLSYWVHDKNGLDRIAAAGAVSDLTFQDGYILFIITGTDRFGITETADDARIINALDFASTGANSDQLVGCVQVERRVWMFGADSIDIFFNSGNSTFPFNRVDGGSSNGFGLAGKDAKVVQDSQVFWCSSDGRIYVSSGYTPNRISHYGIENSLRKYSTLSDCEASEWTENGHKFIAFTFPSGGDTWVFDTTSGMWHERSSGLSSGVWRARLNTRAWGMNLVGDRNSSTIGQLDLELFQEYGEIMQARRVTTVIHASQNVFFTDRLELVMEVGRVRAGGVDPMMSLRWSDDSGYTWSNWIDKSLGEIGQYQQRVTYHRLGAAKNRVYDLKITDNVSRTLIDCVVEGDVGDV